MEKASEYFLKAHRAEEEAMWPQKQRLEWCATHAQECLGTPEAGGGKDGFSFKASGKSMTLLTPWSLTPGLENEERTKVCCVKPPSLENPIWVMRAGRGCSLGFTVLLTYNDFRFWTSANFLTLLNNSFPINSNKSQCFWIKMLAIERHSWFPQLSGLIFNNNLRWEMVWV